ncbi:hypothetical protein FB451DRAFT_1248803 [Mycena latifolia]|nr:hypothetical protein FB451DRAFT_1248803 [Mycena latifolia]
MPRCWTLNLRLMFCLRAASIWSGASWARRSSRKRTWSLMLKFSFLKLSMYWGRYLSAQTRKREWTGPLPGRGG